MNYNILIIDNSTQSVNTFREAFEGHEDTFTFAIFENLQYANKYINGSSAPDLILLNYDAIPEENLGSIKTYFKKDNPEGIPLIAYSSKKNISSAFSEGAKDYITQPMDKSELYFRAKKIIDNHSAFSKIEDQNKKLQLKTQKIRKKTITLFGKNRDLRTAKKEITLQKLQIEMASKEIQASISYAGLIQRAILPRRNDLKKLFPEHFILYRPKDIVSGDFYWVEDKGDRIFIIAADCTGHGVPAAFMSVLGISIFQDIINRDPTLKAYRVLHMMRAKIINILHQKHKEIKSADGMDVALCIIHKGTRKMEYAGAYNSIYLMRKHKLTEYKGDRMPIGIYDDNHQKFTNHLITIRPGDKLYMFSDGYADQFGGEYGKKMRYDRFKSFITDSFALPMIDQKKFLDRTFNKWKGKLEQLDDILVMGIEFSKDTEIFRYKSSPKRATPQKKK